MTTPKRKRIMERLCAAWERWQSDHDDAAYIARVRRILRGRPIPTNRPQTRDIVHGRDQWNRKIEP